MSSLFESGSHTENRKGTGGNLCGPTDMQSQIIRRWFVLLVPKKFAIDIPDTRYYSVQFGIGVFLLLCWG